MMKRSLLIFSALIMLAGIHADSSRGEDRCQGGLVLRLLGSDYLPTSLPSLQGCKDLGEVNRALATALAKELLRPDREVDDGALVHFLEEVQHGYLDGDHRGDFATLVRGLEEALEGHGYRSFLDVSVAALGRFESLDPLIQEIRRETRDAWAEGLFRATEQPARKPLREFPSEARESHGAASMEKPMSTPCQVGEKRHRQMVEPGRLSMWGVSLVVCLVALGGMLWLNRRRAAR